MLLFGISPGKLVEESARRDMEYTYNNAAKTYSKELTQRMRDSLNDDHAQLRIINEFRDALISYKELATRLNINPKVALNGVTTATRALVGVILELNSGGAIRGGKLSRQIGISNE